MTIATVDQLENAVENQFSRYISSKTDPLPTANQAIVGGFHSYFRAAGFPTPTGSQPGATVTALSNASTGAIPFRQQTSPRTSYLAELSASSSAAGATIEIHDRLVEMGALSGTSITTQTITGFDLNLFLATNNIGARIGDANYSDVQWWLEWYTVTGTTNVNWTVNVTYNDGTTGDVVLTAPGTQFRASRMIAINSYIPDTAAGKFIRGVNSVTLNASTGAVGAFGVTATRYRASLFMPTANKVYKNNWTKTGLPEIYNQSCLFPVCITTSSNMGNIRLDGIIAHG